ncbi:IbrB-like domain-containing protein [Lelliottia nimipressuralis]
MTTSDLFSLITAYLDASDSGHQKIERINALRNHIHRHSPFRNEPVDCVMWVMCGRIKANAYNPNKIAPAERKLLVKSLECDGFTQPVVVSEMNDNSIVVDGFHRFQVATSVTSIRERLGGYVPVSVMRTDRQGEKERMSATVRHNRARGKHQITAMSDIVRDLSLMGWCDDEIGKELGMDKDEVLRLKQITGLAELFEHETFSEAWTVE